MASSRLDAPGASAAFCGARGDDDDDDDDDEDDGDDEDDDDDEEVFSWDATRAA